MKRILVLRLSSMGDVLLTLPVMKGVLSCNTDLELVFVTRNKFTPYFAGIDRLIVVPFDPEKAHGGIPGLLRLFKELRCYHFTKVVDLHGVLRTHFLDTLFIFAGCRIYRIRKHRKLRRKVLKNKKINISVPATVTRYLSAFGKAGLTGTVSVSAFPAADSPTGIAGTHKNVIRIGIAPVSKHSTKNWGINPVSELIRLIRFKHPAEIHLFGGPEDQQTLNTLSGPGIINHAGLLHPMDEVSWIRTMDVFVSMDSANMHLAALAGVSTVSIWGATDPRLGFAPLHQPSGNSLFADPDQAVCRPCSVFGEIPCRRSDAPMICMNSIKPEKVMEKIDEILLLSDQK